MEMMLVTFIQRSMEPINVWCRVPPGEHWLIEDRAQHHFTENNPTINLLNPHRFIHHNGKITG